MTVFIAGIYMTPFGKHADKSIKQLSADAVNGALTDAGASREQIQAAYFATATQGPFQGQHTIPGQVALRHMGFEFIPIVNVENACASGTTAFHLACQAVRAGDVEIALAVGAEKMLISDTRKLSSLFDAGWDVETAETNRARLVSLGEGVAVPDGSSMDQPYSVFMDVYAAFCRAHMKNFGTTQEQIAAVCAKNHTHSVHNSLARYQRPFTVEQVLDSPPVVYPLTVAMCAPNADGAAAVVVAGESGLKKLGNCSRAIEVLATHLQSGIERSADDYARLIGRLAADAIYEKAGLGPEDIDVAEVHDATAMGEVLQIANAGFATHENVGPYAAEGRFNLGGTLAVNPSGGLESKGHPIAATGIAQLYELVVQLRREARARQVENAMIALQENGGGLYGFDEAVVAMTILGR